MNGMLWTKSTMLAADLTGSVDFSGVHFICQEILFSFKVSCIFVWNNYFSIIILYQAGLE